MQLLSSPLQSFFGGLLSLVPFLGRGLGASGLWLASFVTHQSGGISEYYDPVLLQHRVQVLRPVRNMHFCSMILLSPQSLLEVDACVKYMKAMHCNFSPMSTYGALWPCHNSFLWVTDFVDAGLGCNSHLTAWIGEGWWIHSDWAITCKFQAGQDKWASL